jgi:hypothetical protein
MYGRLPKAAARKTTTKPNPRTSLQAETTTKSTILTEIWARFSGPHARRWVEHVNLG